MIINLSFNKILPLLALNLFLLKYSYGMFKTPHQPIHLNPNNLVDEQINLIEKTGKEFQSLLGEVAEFEEEKIQINKENYSPKSKVDKFISILTTFIRKQEDLKFPKLDIMINFTNEINPNPFLEEKFVKINPNSILKDALNLVKKFPNETKNYKELFDKLKLFWSDKAGDDDILEYYVEDKNSENPILSMETSKNLESSNKFSQELDNKNFVSLFGDLQFNQPAEQSTQNFVPQQNHTFQHIEHNVIEHGHKREHKKDEDSPLYENLLKLRKTVNNVLKQIFTEFVVGLDYNSFKRMGEEFEKIEELIREYMLEKYLYYYDREKEIEQLRKLYDEIIEENKNLKIQNYLTKHVLDFKNNNRGFGLVVGKIKTIELEDINELINNDYAGLDEELTPSRIIDDKVSKLENNNDIRNIVLKDLWKQNKKKVAIFHLEGGEKEEMKKLTGKL
uniref:Uncharacterized protein n=1 Tax=Meloidogyne floridensis TaxID=298350 RepID=A0A915NP44_9BILA